MERKSKKCSRKSFTSALAVANRVEKQGARVCVCVSLPLLLDFWWIWFESSSIVWMISRVEERLCMLGEEGGGGGRRNNLFRAKRAKQFCLYLRNNRMS